MNIMSLFNEVAVTCYLYVSFLLTDYLDSMIEPADVSDTKDTLSWFLTSILMFTILVNTIYTLYQLAVRLCAYCRRVRESNREELKRESISYKRAKEYNQSVQVIDATRIEGEILVEDLTYIPNNLIQVKRKDHGTVLELHDMFTIKN